MVGETTQNNTRVTMAVLGTKIDHLSEKMDGHATQQEKLWTAHLKVHTDQETRMRTVESLCHDEEPLDKRVQSIERWQEGENVRTGKIAAAQTAISTAIAGAIAYVTSRPPTS